MFKQCLGQGKEFDVNYGLVHRSGQRKMHSGLHSDAS